MKLCQSKDQRAAEEKKKGKKKPIYNLSHPMLDTYPECQMLIYDQDYFAFYISSPEKVGILQHVWERCHVKPEQYEPIRSVKVGSFWARISFGNAAVVV